MANSKFSAEDFATKILNEGGIFDALDYGLKADDLEDQTSDLAKAWRELETIYRDQVEPLAERVDELMAELFGEDLDRGDD